MWTWDSLDVRNTITSSHQSLIVLCCCLSMAAVRTCHCNTQLLVTYSLLLLFFCFVPLSASAQRPEEVIQRYMEVVAGVPDEVSDQSASLLQISAKTALSLLSFL